MSTFPSRLHQNLLDLAYINPGKGFSMPTSAIEWVYLGCAVLGGGIMVIQIAVSLIGADHDVDHDVHVGMDGGDGHGSAAGSWISFRAIIAFLTFFGLGGMVGLSREMGSLASLGLALFCGMLALVLTRTVMMQFAKLRASGTVDIQNTLGAEARVYLTIPAARAGHGAVTVGIQGRTMQFHAITAGGELKTGALCKVSAVHASDTLVVEAL